MKQTAPKKEARLGLEWTLMSVNSIFEQDEHTVRPETFQSSNKENNGLSSNVFNHNKSNGSMTKSKAYISAMQNLQSKVNKLEEENSHLKITIKALREDKNRNLDSSSQLIEELKNRI